MIEQYKAIRAQFAPGRAGIVEASHAAQLQVEAAYERPDNHRSIIYGFDSWCERAWINCPDYGMPEPLTIVPPQGWWRFLLGV